VQPREIILVIDHNPDLYRLAQETFPGVKVIENEQTRGLSGARNSGILQSTGQLIAFMDEDAVAASDWIENLLHGYQDPLVTGVGGEVKPIWVATPPDWFPDEFNWVVGCSYRGLPQTSTPVRNPIGCNMAFRREALIAVGGFRDGIGRVGTIPLGCEETELSIRIRQLNPKAIVLYQPAAVVYHKVPGWRETLGYFARRCYAEGLSKALVSHFVGTNDGLSSERRYIVETLPRGVLTGLGQAIFQGQFAGLKRAIAIVAGLSMTTMGFLVGVVTRARAQKSPALTGPGIFSQTRGS